MNMELKKVARALDRALPWSTVYRGHHKACPCCGGDFRAMRRFHGRPDARCPSCGALERHRILWLFIERELGIDRFSGRMLHVAPEPVLERLFSALNGLEYVAGDLAPQHAGIRRLDVTAIDFPSASFDIVMMNHVLEHVPDDFAAIREIRRVLPPNGLVLMQHPLHEERAETYEDASITTKADRRAKFGQEDHVRIYGRDFASRLEQGDFVVERRRYVDELSTEERERYALCPLGHPDPGADIYLLRPIDTARP
jgi:SAM-dependent methyltransferase